MIGFSCPPMCFMPFGEAAELVSTHFEHWELVSEVEHRLPDIEAHVADFLETSGMGMSVHAPFSDINPAAFDPRAREFAVRTLSDVVRSCHRLGIGPVTVHPGVIGPIQKYHRERVLALTRKSLEELSVLANDLGVAIALENMPAMKGTVCQTARELADVCHGLEMGICFDMGHANISGQMDEMLALADRFANIHVHDNVGGPSDQHLALGRGNVDFSVLRGLAYRGNHIIEVNNPDMAEAAASRRYLEAVLE